MKKAITFMLLSMLGFTPALALAEASATTTAVTTDASAPVISPVTVTRFERDLKFGMRGEDVRALAVLLNSATSTRFSKPGFESDKFDAKLRAAVKKFQKLNKLPSTGNVASRTRAILNPIFRQNPTAPGIPALTVIRTAPGTSVVRSTFDGAGETPTIYFLYGATPDSMTIKSTEISSDLRVGTTQVTISNLDSQSCYVQSVVTNSIGSTKSAFADCSSR